MSGKRLVRSSDFLGGVMAPSRIFTGLKGRMNAPYRRQCRGGSECAGDRGHGIAAVGSAPDAVVRRIDGVDRALRTSIDGVTADVERGGQSG